jgi:hypothetical protein
MMAAKGGEVSTHPDEKKILLDEIERLAKRVQELKGLNGATKFYGLPLWVQAVAPAAVQILAKGNPVFEEFRLASYGAFEVVD